MDNEALDRMTMALMGTSPTDEAQMALLDTQPVVQILPEANVIKIGGQSFIDRGQIGRASCRERVYGTV